jgi:hypothetical protein
MEVPVFWTLVIGKKMDQNVNDPIILIVRATEALLGVADLLDSLNQHRFAALLRLIALEVDEHVGELKEEMHRR